MPTVSCLVISRSADLLNGLLASLEGARGGWGPGDEVLCSWNGSDLDERQIQPPSGAPPFRIAQRVPYHFATNMNQLADAAAGEVLILLNDDLVLDPGSLDQALRILETQAGIGLVGARLRSPNGLLGHAGILFNHQHLPYNRFRPERLGAQLEARRLEPQRSGEMPAVTGALMVLRRHDFLRVRLREAFRICGEDVALCLDLRRQLGLLTYYATAVTAVHAEKSSRGEQVDPHDDELLAELVAQACAQDPWLPALNSGWATEEADVLELLLRQAEADQAQTENRLAQAHSDLAWEQGKLRQSQHALESCGRDLESCAQDLENARQAIDYWQGAHAALLTSSSWALTAPYRAVGAWLAARRTRS